MNPGSVNHTANSNGIYCEWNLKEAGGKIYGLTNRNFMLGIWLRMRQQEKSKSHSYSEQSVKFLERMRKNEVDIRWKLTHLSEEVSRAHGEDDSFYVP